jgi:hypothetical protein
MGTLNEIITIVAIALKQNQSLEPLIAKYGSEMIADAMQFIKYEQRETIELEEHYEGIT